MKFMLEQIGEKDLWCIHHDLSAKHDQEVKTSANEKIAAETAIYSAGFCTINVTVALSLAGKLNQRQLWFLGYL
jgi:hypothetical protein